LADLLFGTSGYSYKEWVGPFYEKTEKMFSYYSSFFQTVEINSTFYAYPSRGTIFGLNRVSRKDFVFSVKLPRLITHEKHLNPELKIENDLLRFLELLNPLKAMGKLGCILIQLPPSFAYDDRERLDTFLGLLPEGYEFAAEFRHHSWMRDGTWNMLRNHNVAYCVVDEPLLPSEVRVTADFAYFRWHGRGARPWYNYRYSEEELKEWVPRIEETMNGVNKIYGYFNNHFHGYAVENCIEILEMLNAAKTEHREIRERIVQYNARRIRKRRKTKEISEYPIPGQNLGSLLIKLTDRGRIERANAIKDEEISIEETSKRIIKARIRDYVVEIQPEERIMKHDCDDWQKGLGMKRLCKHIVKILMTLDQEVSVKILRDMVENRDLWSFQLYLP